MCVFDGCESDAPCLKSLRIGNNSFVGTEWDFSLEFCSNASMPCISLDLDSFCEFRGGINALVHVLRATFVSRR